MDSEGDRDREIEVRSGHEEEVFTSGNPTLPLAPQGVLPNQCPNHSARTTMQAENPGPGSGDEGGPADPRRYSGPGRRPDLTHGAVDRMNKAGPARPIMAQKEVAQSGPGGQTHGKGGDYNSDQLMSMYSDTNDV